MKHIAFFKASVSPHGNRKSRLWSSLIFGTFFALLLGAGPARADCCSWPGCNVGSSCCNIFCCNCDGPCANYGCSCPPVYQSGDVCGQCPGYDTCVNSSGQCTGYCNPGTTCCNNGQSCCSTAADGKVTTEGAKPVTKTTSGSGQCAPGGGGKAEPKQSPSERFDSVDTNKDKKITLQEAQAWLKKRGSSMTADDVSQGFKKMDTNGNGTIEPGEFDAKLK